MQAFDAGDLERSKHFGVRLLGVEPGSSRAHWLLGSIGLRESEMATAIRHAELAARKAAALPPHQLVAITRLLITVGSFETAHRLLDGMGKNAAIGNALIATGEQLVMLERYQDALACLQLAEDSGIRHPMLSYLISSTCRYLGDFARATDAAEDTLRQQPDFAHAHWLLSQLGSREGAGMRIDRIKRSIDSLAYRRDADAPQIASGRALLFHALFRELDALDERGQAWNALNAGLAIKRALQPHDPGTEDRMFDSLISTYTAEFMQPADACPQATTPIFIIGMPRTGTTLVERIVTNHSQVAGCGELDEMQLLVKRFTGHWSPVFLDSTLAGLIPGANLAGLGAAYLREIAWRIGSKRFMVDKHQSNFLLAGVIARCLPQARILHVSRDAADACFSNLKEPFAAHAYSYSNDQRHVANHFRNHDRLMRHVGQEAPGRILEVRYEELVRDRDGQSSRILEFLDLPPEEGVVDTSNNQAPVASASSVQVREPIHDRNIGGWRRYEDKLSVLVDALKSHA